MTSSDSLKKLIISTLGPMGTCSENACRHYLDTYHDSAGKIKLHPTFEDAIAALVEVRSDFVLIPSAYRNFADIIFLNRHHVEIADVFILPTPKLVLARKKDGVRVSRVASHGSPSVMVGTFFPDAEMVYSKSNSDSAEMLMAGLVEACLTTDICAFHHSLEIMHDLGSVVMGWNMFIRKRSVDCCALPFAG
jgi:prephenate dehydratase